MNNINKVRNFYIAKESRRVSASMRCMVDKSIKQDIDILFASLMTGLMMGRKKKCPQSGIKCRNASKSCRIYCRLKERGKRHGW